MNDNANSLGIFTESISNLVCPNCDSELDVSEFQVFEDIECPVCKETLKVPGRLGDFILIEELGRGAMGCVYLAMDESLNRLVALKVIRKEYGQDPKMLESVQREAQAMATLNHRNIVQVYSFGRMREQPYFVMELLQGERLDEMMAGGTQIDEIRALEIAIDVAQGLEAANSAGLTHGDIKPANILMNDHGVAKVVDFGLAKFMEPGQEIEVWGTPYYIAPEKARKKGEDSRSDQYSLGGTIFHALAGQPPFDGPTPTKVVVAALKEDTPLLSDFNPELTPKTVAVIRRMMDKSPNRRYPTYASLLADLNLALQEAKAAAERRRQEEQRLLEKQKKKIGPLAWIMMGVTLVVLTGIGGVVWLQSRGGEEVRTYEGPQRELHQPFIRAEERNLEEAVAELRKGNLSKAEENLDVVYRHIPENHAAKGWAQYLEAGIRLFAQYPDEARELLEQVAGMDDMIFDTSGVPDEDPRILARYALGQDNEREFQKAIRRGRPYYAHLGELAKGYRDLLAEDRNSSARYFRAYSEYSSANSSWPYVLRPIAPQLHLPLERLVSEEVKEEKAEERGKELLSDLGVRTSDGKPFFRISSVRYGTDPVLDKMTKPGWKEVDGGSVEVIDPFHILTNAGGVQPLPGREFTLVAKVSIPKDELPDHDLVVFQFGGFQPGDAGGPDGPPYGLVAAVSGGASVGTSIRLLAGDGRKQTLLQSLPISKLERGKTCFISLVWDGDRLGVWVDGTPAGRVDLDTNALPDASGMNVVSIGSGIGPGEKLTWGGGLLVHRTYVFDTAMDPSKSTLIQSGSL